MALRKRLFATLFALSVAVSLVAPPTLVSLASGQPGGVSVVLDMDVSGNGPRSVGSLESCISIAAERQVDIDIVVPPPGIPTDEGIAGFEFGFFYDAQLLSLAGQNVDLLLAQAPGSSVVPFSGPLPSETGDHELAVIDLGGSGIEPAGSSETGPGVLARMSLLPKATGIARIAVRNIRLATDSLEIVEITPAALGSIAVGVPCPSPTPGPATPAPPTPSAAASPPVASPALRTGTQSTPGGVTELVASGGPSGPRSNQVPILLIAIGAGAVVLGAAFTIMIARR
jgi:hypothetical protein